MALYEQWSYVDRTLNRRPHPSSGCYVPLLSICSSSISAISDCQPAQRGEQGVGHLADGVTERIAIAVPPDSPLDQTCSGVATDLLRSRLYPPVKRVRSGGTGEIKIAIAHRDAAHIECA